MIIWWLQERDKNHYSKAWPFSFEALLFSTAVSRWDNPSRKLETISDQPDLINPIYERKIITKDQWSQCTILRREPLTEWDQDIDTSYEIDQVASLSTARLKSKYVWHFRFKDLLPCGNSWMAVAHFLQWNSFMHRSPLQVSIGIRPFERICWEFGENATW